MIDNVLVEEQKKKLDEKLAKVEKIRSAVVEDIKAGRYEKSIEAL